MFAGCTLRQSAVLHVWGAPTPELRMLSDGAKRSLHRTFRFVTQLKAGIESHSLKAFHADTLPHLQLHIGSNPHTERPAAGQCAVGVQHTGEMLPAGPDEPNCRQHHLWAGNKAQLVVYCLCARHMPLQTFHSACTELYVVTAVGSSQKTVHDACHGMYKCAHCI